MKIHSVHMRNFRLHADTELVFPDGITALVAPNETGKSTVLEAVCFAFFGAAGTRGKKEKMRWAYAPPRQTAQVVVVFSLGGLRYKIERSEHTAQMWEGSTIVAEGTDPVTRFATGVLGMSRAEFLTSYLVEQGEVKRIALMKPTERQTFIRQVMGVGTVDDALDACRKAKNEIGHERDAMMEGLGVRPAAATDDAAREVDAAEVVLSEAKTNAQAAEERASSAEERLEKLAAVKERHDGAVRDLDRASKNAARSEQDCQRYETKLAEIERAATKLDEEEPKLARLPELRELRDQLVGARAAASERATLAQNIEQYRAEIEQREAAITDAENQVALYSESEHKAAEEMWQAHDVALREMRAERELARSEALADERRYQAEMKAAKERVETIVAAGDTGACPTCARPLEDAFDAVVAVLNEQIEAADVGIAMSTKLADECSTPSDDEMALAVDFEDAEEAVNRMRQLERDAALATSNIEKNRRAVSAAKAFMVAAETKLASLSTVEYSEVKLQTTEGMIRDLEQLDHELSQLRGMLTQRSGLEAMLEQAKREADESSQQAAAQEKLIEELAFDQTLYLKTLEAAREARDQANAANIAAARAEEARDAAVRTREAAAAALADYDARALKVTELEESYRLHEQTAEALNRFRVAIATTIRPEMEELISGFFSMLTDGLHEAVELTEDFQVVVYEDGVEMDVVSGGANDLVALATRLAVSQQIAERAGNPLSLLILDEIFGSQDVERRGNIMSLVRQLGGIFEQVILISHVAETRDAADQVIEFVRDREAGCTRVVA